MQTRTKIVATLGPSSESQQAIAELIEAGATVFRLNAKHSEPEWLEGIIARIRAVAGRRNVGIMLDLKGPEIRIGEFEAGHAELKEGSTVVFSPGELGSQQKIILNDTRVLRKIKPGHTFYIDDGKFEFRATSASAGSVRAKVVRGGKISNHKSVNLPDADLDLPVLEKKDFEMIRLGLKNQVDFFALSFVRNRGDIQSLRRRIAGSRAKIIAKIERPQAIGNFTEILEEADAIMVARGDLGIEIPLTEVPLVQKDLIRKAREAAKPVITATQMLESMIENPRPTRAEVSDVANAILDGTDAVMLSAETAIGHYPVEAVRVMAQIDESINSKNLRGFRPAHQKPGNTTEAVSQAVDTLSRYPLDFKAIVLLTETGRTARMIAKFEPTQPIYGITDDRTTANQMSLLWGVNPRVIKFKHAADTERIFSFVLSVLKSEKALRKGDKVLCISGSIVGRENLTNSIKIHPVA